MYSVLIAFVLCPHHQTACIFLFCFKPSNYHLISLGINLKSLELHYFSHLISCYSPCSLCFHHIGLFLFLEYSIPSLAFCIDSLIWNALPPHIHISHFKSSWKYHVLSDAFPGVILKLINTATLLAHPQYSPSPFPSDIYHLFLPTGM